MDARGVLAGIRPTALQLISVAVSLGVWELYARATSTFGFPAPSDVATAWVDLASSGALLAAVMTSVQALGLGLALALVLGFALGMLMANSDAAEGLLRPYVNALMALPSVAYIPLVMIWLGTGLAARVAIVFEYGFFLVAVSTLAAMRAVDRTLVEMAVSIGMSRLALIRRILLPAAAPAFAATFRLAFNRCVKGTVNAELLLALTGLGGMIAYYGKSFNEAYLFASVVTVILLAAGANLALSRLPVIRMGRALHATHI